MQHVGNKGGLGTAAALPLLRWLRERKRGRIIVRLVSVECSFVPPLGVCSPSALPERITAGTLEVRLAASPAEIQAAQELRYHVFYDEMGAQPLPALRAARRDHDSFDAICDHLLVLDQGENDRAPRVVGTYRLLRRAVAHQHGGFYSASEYDLSPLERYPGEILELGRSCIDADYRTGAVMQILWKGLAAYIFQHDIRLMFGCASLPGTDPQALAVPLSYLYYDHLAPPSLRCRALPDKYVDMRLLPREAFNPEQAFDTLKLDPRSGGNQLPPLIKGYLRVGGVVGDGAVVDTAFNTTDVCIIVRTNLMAQRYLRHYERKQRDEAERG